MVFLVAMVSLRTFIEPMTATTIARILWRTGKTISCLMGGLPTSATSGLILRIGLV